MTGVTSEEALKLISQAWGKNKGYVFFPHIDREEQERVGLRRAGYYENEAFRWPRDRQKIIAHMDAHRGQDLYWCPSVFEYKERKTEYAMEEYALWADLDEADPRQIDSDYMPTIAWQTSPGRFQALWIIKNGDLLGASWPGRENQRLTYYVGADRSGWDTTQLLRIPGWNNHKPEHRKNGKPVRGKILWKQRGNYTKDDFQDLPEVEGALEASQITDAISTEIDNLDRSTVISRFKLRLNQTARDLLYAREAAGDRSDQLWYLTRCLADAGCTVSEIVCVVRETVWNKFEGRADELKRLITEATKAIAQRDPELAEQLDEERAPKASPTRLAAFLKDVKKPEWLVDGIATKGSVGFVAGQPKSFKSWVALDLALSISTGARFLDHFQVVEPGPVLYIQEEDSAITIKARTRKIWKGKAIDKLKLQKDGSVVWEPGNEADFDPDIAIYLQEGFILSEGHWQEWLDDTLAQGLDGRPFVMVIIDTLMNVAGDVEENKAQMMTTKIFKPLKLLARKHEVAVRLVHHMKKGGEDGDVRGGQRMLGSVANHAWAEDSLYLTRRMGGKLKMEFESKSAPEKTYTIGNLDNFEWAPLFDPEKPDVTGAPTVEKANGRRRSNGHRGHAQQDILDLLAQGGVFSTQDIASATTKPYGTVYRKLRDMESADLIARVGKQWTSPSVN